ncbi:hypothetical protein V5P93_004430 [Actinokineospora auranticolor]|uniref:Syndecan 1 n=1 Tax=Actinokineospora auranticolor TaxID=155976 RepID=A0A2S6GT91_9PSEU|nr:hypothetical protein [Actinokineospora auranticolor]PPK68462.1 hypothetical protein CLV40_105185 [Actinokineospora auranticolor]
MNTTPTLGVAQRALPTLRPATHHAPAPTPKPHEPTPTVQRAPLEVLSAPRKPPEVAKPAPRTPVQRTAPLPHPGAAGPASASDLGAATGSRHLKAVPERENHSTADLDDLARRLFDPLSRLLRADLRQSRDRAGRPYDR